MCILEKIKDVIDEGKRFLITSHIDPDGDAIGATFAMHWALRGLGKESFVYLADHVPYRYAFLPGPADVMHQCPHEHYDVIFVVDCGNLFRVGKEHERLKSMGTIVNIDHHATNESFGSINLIDEGASSTAEMLYGLFEFMKVAVGYNVAVNIYTAVFTDTGSLRYDNTNSKAFTICEKMLSLGVRPSYVSQMVYENHPKERFVLLGLVFNTLRTFDNDRFAVVHVTEEMFRSTGSTAEYVDGFVEYVKEIRGVDAAVLLRQIEKGRYKVSMRSKGTVNVAEICSIFGGGGHRAAAGCRIDGTLEIVEEKLLKALRKNGQWGK